MLCLRCQNATQQDACANVGCLSMRKSILSVLGLVFCLPAGAVVVQHYEAVLSPFAFAEEPDLMSGCTDVPEAVALMEELGERRLRIKRYLEEMDNRERELQVAEASLRARLTELKAAKASILSNDTHQKTRLQDDIDRLVAVYDKMKPAEAAAVLTNLPVNFAAEILMRVEPETGARIIAAVEPNQAAVLTTHMGARSVNRK